MSDAKVSPCCNSSISEIVGGSRVAGFREHVALDWYLRGVK